MPQQQNKTFTNWYNQKAIPFIQETKWIFLAFFLFGAFHTVIESFLNTILVNPILSKFEDNWVARIGLIAIIIYSLIKIIISFKNKKHISFKHFICLILPTLIYIYYRDYGSFLLSFIPLEHTYHFLKVGNYPIAYLDIIFICLIVPTLIAFIFNNKQNTKKTTKALLYPDNPITKIEEELLGRIKTSESIAQLINDKIENDNTSFTLAITSKWGNGKTSFINLILNQLNKNKYESFEFQAWKISNSEDITSTFFKELAKKIKPYHSNLTDDIANYGQTLTNNSNSSAISLIHNICSLSSSKTIEEKFNSINKQLEKINKKFIIIIDDLDRLDGNEIFSLLKIMRNSAYFNNLLFISAFDEDYVIKALDKINIPKPEQYIDKIFESKYSLIAPNKQTITNLLRTKILSIIEKENNITQDIIDIEHYDFNTINEISNIRDVYSLLNIFTFSYRTLQGGVSIIDLLYISIFKYKYEIAYFDFINNFNKFTYMSDDYYNLYNGNSNNKRLNYIEYFHQNYKEDSNNIIALINKLFSKKKHIYSFCKAQYTKCYLDNQHSNILQKDFNQLYSLQLEDIYKQLNKYTESQLPSYKDLLTNWLIFTIEDCEKYMESIFYMGSKKDFEIINVQQIEGLINKELLNGDKIKELVETTEYYYSTYKYEFLKETHEVIKEKFSIDQIIDTLKKDIEECTKSFFEDDFYYLLKIYDYFKDFKKIYKEKHKNTSDKKEELDSIASSVQQYMTNYIFKYIDQTAGLLIHSYEIVPSNPHKASIIMYGIHHIINDLWPDNNYDRCINDLKENNNGSDTCDKFIAFLKIINEQIYKHNNILVEKNSNEHVTCYVIPAPNNISIAKANMHTNYKFLHEDDSEKVEQLAKEIEKQITTYEEVKE